MDKTETMHELCEMLSRELEDANDKIRKAGGKLSAGDLEYVDKLTHAIKSLKTVIAMDEQDEDGYSGYYRPMYTYADGRGGMTRSTRGSYDRGRARRDSMGRYSRDGYSRAEDAMDDVLEEMRGMMGDLPEDKRREVQKFIDRMG